MEKRACSLYVLVFKASNLVNNISARYFGAEMQAHFKLIIENFRKTWKFLKVNTTGFFFKFETKSKT